MGRHTEESNSCNERLSLVIIIIQKSGFAAVSGIQTFKEPSSMSTLHTAPLYCTSGDENPLCGASLHKSDTRFL